jgi:rhamnogalacturonan endolyase
MKKVFTLFVLLISLGLFASGSIFAQRYMENLNRGIVAVRTSASEVLISWRILGNEYSAEATYNLYRGSALIASNLSVSNYIDNTGSDYSYSVVAVINGTEQKLSSSVTPWSSFYKTIPLSRPNGGTTPDGISYTYEPNDASIGDIDGDGDYELVLKWQPTNARDNASSGYTGNTILDGLEMDGTLLWRIDLGINIRSGAHYTQFMVYDLDGDGDAEVACKTADGTVDGVGNVIGDGNADYRNSSGYILSGPEYLTIFSGASGRAMETVSYLPARGTVSDWGDSYGNRVDRFLACIAYLDGEEPSLVMCRGYYTRCVLVAWDYRSGNLTRRWTFDSDNSGNSAYAGQGAHSISVGDVDNDGKDEIMYGACAIDNDGRGLYSTGYGHGDATHLADINPNSNGLEFFMCHESANGSTIPGLSMRNAGTGSMNWTVSANGDIGRCLTMDIDPNYYGYECWGSDGSGIHDAYGNVITTTYPTSTGGGTSYNFGIWWDGDVLREILDRTVINKWDYNNQSTNRMVTLYNYNVSSNNSTKYNPCLMADMMGDWREEVIYRSSDNNSLVLFTTPYSTSQRMYTLMHDPQYRLSIAWQNTGYNQPPHLGFYFGHGMGTPPDPNIQIVGESDPDDEYSLTIQENENGFCSVDGTIDNDNAGYTGDGFANTTNSDNNGITWTVYATSSGAYTLTWRFANGGATDRTCDLLINDATVRSGISMVTTGSWTDWTTIPVSGIILSEGSNKIRIQATTSSGLANIDYIKIAGPSSITGIACSGLKNASGIPSLSGATHTSLFPNPVSEGKLHVNTNIESASELTVSVYNNMGVQVKYADFGILEKGNHVLLVNVGDLPSGTYFIRIRMDGKAEIHSFIKK